MYYYTKSPVYNRGIPPDSFLDELIAWGKTAPLSIFSENSTHDIFTNVAPTLGPYQSIYHRRSVLLEVLRVLAGFESAWDWNAGVDTHNPTSITPETIEAGAWQVSANSVNFGEDLKALFLMNVGSFDGTYFQQVTKENHPFAIEYIARLLRHTVNHNGPVKRHEIDEWLSHDAVVEFYNLLNT